MLDLPNALPDPSSLDPEERLFVHTERPQWGVGLWVKEQSTRRRMRFEDGEIRAFKKGWYHMLELVDPGRPDLDDLFEALADEHELAIAEQATLQARKERPPAMSFSEQCAVFRHEYADGFKDEAYLDAARRRPTGKPCKRHVEEEVALTRTLLSKAALQTQLAAEDHAGVVDSLIAVLKRTTLVKPRNGHKLLAEIEDPSHLKTVALAAYRLLHGKKRFRKRFRSWIRALKLALGARPAWPLATVFPALMYPDEHVCVKRRTFNLQARELRPGLHLRKKVNRRAYRKARRLARMTRARLEEEGLAPADLLDVRRFMWDTLRPRGQSILEEMNSGGSD